MNTYENSLIISAEKGINISLLIETLTQLNENNFVEEDIDLNLEDSKTAAKIHTLAEVLDTKYDDSKIHIKYKTDRHNSDKIKRMVYGK